MTAQQLGRCDHRCIRDAVARQEAIGLDQWRKLELIVEVAQEVWR